MEYLIGSALTFFMIYLLSKSFSSKALKVQKLKPKISQSYLYQFLSSYVEKDFSLDRPRQSSDFLNRQYVKVVVLEDRAYWIHQNQLYTAHYEDGEVDRMSAEQVDTFSMSPSELEKTKYVVDKLTEGKSEDSDSGH